MREGKLKFVVIKMGTANIYGELFINTAWSHSSSQADIFTHCSVNGSDFQKSAILSCSELPEVITLSLAYKFILITNSFYNL